MTGFVAVTGATGFLGSALCLHLSQRGVSVRALARRPESRSAGLEGLEWFPCRLPDGIDERALAGVTALVHCAFETRFEGEARARAANVEGSKRLFEAARRQGVERIVFVSSMSAHEEARSIYGRTKLEVEALLDLSRDAALRPGHILGEGGVFWRTARMIRTLPVIPLFFGGRQQIQTVALADVVEALAVILERRLTGVLKFAEAEPMTLREFYAAVAEHLGKVPRFVRLPGGLAVAGLRACEAVGFPLPLSSDNLEGLRCLRAFDVARDLERLGIQPRSMQQSLAGIRWNSL